MMLKTKIKLLIATLLTVFVLSACEHHHQGLDINNPWALALPSVAENGAAYLSIHNHEEADQLIAVSSNIADKVEIHQHINQDGQMSMVKVDVVDIRRHSELIFQPGGYHIMLIGLMEPLKNGNHFSLNLVFKNAGEKQTMVEITDQPPEISQSKHHH